MSKTKESVTFIATDQNLRLVKEPKRKVMVAETGELIGKPGTCYEFSHGVLDVDPGDKAALKFLRDHDLHGTTFVEKGNEPDRPVDSSAVLEKIVGLAVDGDADALEEVFLAERASHSRPEVLAAAAKAIEAIGEDVPDPPPTPVHQYERFRDPSVQVGPDVPPDLIADHGAEPTPVPDQPKPKAKPKAKGK